MPAQRYKEERLDVRRQPDYVTFRWKHPRKSIAACRNPVYLDLDGALLSVRRIYPELPWWLGTDRLDPLSRPVDDWSDKCFLDECERRTELLDT